MLCLLVKASWDMIGYWGLKLPRRARTWFRKKVFHNGKRGERTQVTNSLWVTTGKIQSKSCVLYCYYIGTCRHTAPGFTSVLAAVKSIPLMDAPACRHAWPARWYQHQASSIKITRSSERHATNTVAFVHVVPQMWPEIPSLRPNKQQPKPL